MMTHRPITRIAISAAAAVAFIATPYVVWADPPSTLERLQARVEQLVASFPGTIGVFAHHVQTGAEIAVNADRPFPMASTFKVPIMVQTFREIDAGRLSLDDRFETGPDNRRLGSGLLTQLQPGLNPTLHDLLLMMIVVSDNQATDMVLGLVPPAKVTAGMRELGIDGIRVDRTVDQLIGDFMGLANPVMRGKTSRDVFTDPSLVQGTQVWDNEGAARAFSEDLRDVATPRAMTELLLKIHRSEAASEASCAQMLGILRTQQFTQRIPRYLPEGTAFAGKTGTIGFTTNDTGIIFAGDQTIALTVYTLLPNLEVPRFKAEQAIGEIAREIYDYFRYTAPGGEREQE
jgi:beta-lactamase class A